MGESASLVVQFLPKHLRSFWQEKIRYSGTLLAMLNFGQVQQGPFRAGNLPGGKYAKRCVDMAFLDGTSSKNTEKFYENRCVRYNFQWCHGINMVVITHLITFAWIWEYIFISNYRFIYAWLFLPSIQYMYIYIHMYVCIQICITMLGVAPSQ